MDRVYWDSACFLGFLLEEPDRVRFCEEVLIDARDGRLQIVTSALTIAEVLAVRNKPKIPDDQRKIVERFFKNEFVIVTSVTRRTAEIARELVWDSNIKPKDAVHVAAAIEAKLSVLHTFDRGLIKKSGKVGGDAPLSIHMPNVISPRLPFSETDQEPKRVQ
jgi:predicted nucleic acid-binding protein